MKLALQQAAYQARNVIANAQSCYNLYAEQNPPDAPFPITHYPAPGLTLYADYSGYGSRVRGLYVTSYDATPVACVGQTLLNVATGAVLGTLPTNSGNPVKMTDNGTTLVVVDGTSYGGQAALNNLVGGALTAISDTAFYGSNNVDFIDTFTVFNQPGTRNWYTTTSNVMTPFDPLYFAGKAGYNDLLVAVACLHDNIWVLGEATTEIWFNAGGATFPFSRMPNSILQQGCVAAYSPVVADNAIYWLSEDRHGKNMCMRGEGYSAKRISNFAVEDAWSKYPTIGDAVGMAYQIGGHETVGFFFPAANAWWAYDVSAQLWHQRTYNGVTDAWLPYCMAFRRAVPPTSTASGVYVGDRQSGKIYTLDRNAYTDAGTAIQRQRSWMHVQNEGNRAVHNRFWLNFNGYTLSPDTLQLSWSDNGGNTYGSQVAQACGNDPNGNYQWRRLGYARDRVYRLDWTGQGEFALNGAWIDVTQQGT